MSNREQRFREVADHYSAIINDPKRWWWSKVWAAIMLGTTLSMWENGPIR